MVWRPSLRTMGDVSRKQTIRCAKAAAVKSEARPFGMKCPGSAPVGDGGVRIEREKQASGDDWFHRVVTGVAVLRNQVEKMLLQLCADGSALQQTGCHPRRVRPGVISPFSRVLLVSPLVDLCQVWRPVRHLPARPQRRPLGDLRKVVLLVGSANRLGAHQQEIDGSEVVLGAFEPLAAGRKLLDVKLDGVSSIGKVRSGGVQSSDLRMAETFERSRIVWIGELKTERRRSMFQRPDRNHSPVAAHCP